MKTSVCICIIRSPPHAYSITKQTCFSVWKQANKLTRNGWRIEFAVSKTLFSQSRLKRNKKTFICSCQSNNIPNVGDHNLILLMKTNIHWWTDNNKYRTFAFLVSFVFFFVYCKCSMKTNSIKQYTHSISLVIKKDNGHTSLIYTTEQLKARWSQITNINQLNPIIYITSKHVKSLTLTM